MPHLFLCSSLGICYWLLSGKWLGVTCGLPQDGGFYDTRAFLKLNFLEVGKPAFCILVSATHSLFRVSCAVAKPAQHAFGQGHCGLPLQRTACASSCPWLIYKETKPPPPPLKWVLLWWFSLPDVPIQRRESRPPPSEQHPTVAIG